MRGKRSTVLLTIQCAFDGQKAFWVQEATSSVRGSHRAK